MYSRKLGKRTNVAHYICRTASDWYGKILNLSQWRKEIPAGCYIQFQLNDLSHPIVMDENGGKYLRLEKV